MLVVCVTPTTLALRRREREPSTPSAFGRKGLALINDQSVQKCDEDAGRSGLGQQAARIVWALLARAGIYTAPALAA
jgi:hypothetical protein